MAFDAALKAPLCKGSCQKSKGFLTEGLSQFALDKAVGRADHSPPRFEPVESNRGGRDGKAVPYGRDRKSLLFLHKRELSDNFSVIHKKGGYNNEKDNCF